MTGIESTGAKEIARNLQKIADAQTLIARGAVLSATSVMAEACRDAAPGTTKQEVGRFVEADGPVARGRAGLMKLPKRGQTGKRPHAFYLTLGTKFIAARQFIAKALSSSRPLAMTAIEKSVDRSIATIVSRP